MKASLQTRELIMKSFQFQQKIYHKSFISPFAKTNSNNEILEEDDGIFDRLLNEIS